jgi:hypothetical protein
MNDQWNDPSFDGLILQSNDSLGASDPHGVSPFADNTEPVAAAESAESFQTFNRKAFARLRSSPAGRLLNGSPWTLRAYQLDMDSPPSLNDYLVHECKTLLEQQGGNDLCPTQLRINFLTDIYPDVGPEGIERHECSLTVVDLARTSLDPAAFLGLIRSMEADRVLHPSVPSLTLKKLTCLIVRARWMEDYQAQLDGFWEQHEPTYRLLSKLSFMDGCYQLRSQRKISLESYALALDALGQKTFPTHLDTLTRKAVARHSIVSVVELDDQVVPGIFQLKSKNTSHCYLHILGEHAQCIEYISSNAPWREQTLLNALNGSPWHRRHLDSIRRAGQPSRLVMRECSEDLFAVLTLAQRQFSTKALPVENVANEPDEADASDRWRMPVNRSLKLIGALDIWGEQSDVRTRIPAPMKTANRLMRRWLTHDHAVDAKPEHVFIRYLPGTSFIPLGHARAPATQIQIPDLSAVALDKALMDNYRVQHPVGYVDQGGRTAVYLDVTGEGKWDAKNELSLSADAIEQHVTNVDFLALMSRQLQGFWDREGSAIESTLRKTFVGQALVSLKRGKLSRASFDLLVEVLEEWVHEPKVRKTRWSSLGFHLERRLGPGTHCPCCAGLLVFSHDENPGYVLYQPGQEEPFFEYQDRRELGAHLMRSAADPNWRQTLLNYVPMSRHARLEYILTLWGEVRAAPEPMSNLRPWLDAIYHEDVHKAKARAFCEHPTTLSAFAFICQAMRDNSLSDAQDSITTSAQVSLRNWTQRLNRLQLLLAPLSMLLAPAAVASIVTAAGTFYLEARSASLPGNRDKEKRQLLLTALSLGLLGTGALTPGLLRAARTLTTTHNLVKRGASVTTRGFSSVLQRSMSARRTQLERFFGSGSLLKSWSVPGYSHFSTLPVKAWKLERKFLLWTAEREQARTLVVSTHGYYLPWTKSTAIPHGTELRTYVPHGFELIDPRLHRVVSQSIEPYSLMNAAGNTPGPAFSQLPAWQLTDKALAGTAQVGKIKNYTLGKFQSERYESYRDISNVVRHSRQSPFFGQLMPTPMDVLSVRNRFGTRNPTLQDLFETLAGQGIHYDHILLLHCRCSAISSALGRSPAFSAPIGSVPISP